MLPEGHTFKSVGRYQIEEDVPAGNSAFNRNKTFGQQHTSFVVRFTEDGKETESSAGKTSYIYYDRGTRRHAFDRRKLSFSPGSAVFSRFFLNLHDRCPDNRALP